MRVQIIKYYDPTPAITGAATSDVPSFGAMLGEQMGGQAASGIVNGLMGMLFQGEQNRNQLNQQQALTNMQLDANKQMSAFNFQQQYDMWQKTNYPAQVQQLEQAGLNPALLYAKGGPGGMMGTPSGGISGGTAAPMSLAGMGVMNAQQLQMNTAQIRLMNAQAAQAEANAQKTAGIDTTVGYQTLQNLQANVQNTQANTQLQNIQTQLTGVQKTIQEATSLDQISSASLNAQKLQQEVFQLQNQTDISDQTKNTIIKTVQQNYANAVISGALMKNNIEVDQATIQKMSADIAQGWTKLDQTALQTQFSTTLQAAQTGLVDKEKSLLTWQTIIAGINAGGNLMKNIGTTIAQ